MLRPKIFSTRNRMGKEPAGIFVAHPRPVQLVTHLCSPSRCYINAAGDEAEQKCYDTGGIILLVTSFTSSVRLTNQ